MTPKDPARETIADLKRQLAEAREQLAAKDVRRMSNSTNCCCAATR